jgi:hypothetical protein
LRWTTHRDCAAAARVLYQSVTALAYYCDSNPGMIRQTSHALAEVLADRSR